MSRVFLGDLEADEAHWVNSFTIHGCGTFNGLNLSMQQEESPKDVNEAELAKADYISSRPSFRLAYIKAGSFQLSLFFLREFLILCEFPCFYFPYFVPSFMYSVLYIYFPL